MTALTMRGMLSAADGLTQTFLAQSYPALATVVATPVYLTAVLYWALYGYKVAAGHSPLDWSALVARAVMTSAVFSLLHWGGLASQVYQSFVTWMNQGAGTLMAGEPALDMLDALCTQVNAMADQLRSSNLYELGMVLDGLALFVVNGALFAIALCYLTLAKFGLAITMALLPLFVGFAMFQQTRQWFMNWLGYMMTYTLLYILVIAIVRFGFLAFGEAIHEAGRATGMVEGKLVRSEQTAQLMLLEAALCLFMWRAREWAGGLSGAATSSTGALVMVARAAMVAGTGRYGGRGKATA